MGLEKDTQSDLHPYKGIKNDGEVLGRWVSEITVAPGLDIKEDIAVKDEKEDDKQLVKRLA
jgi:hypothetical protein